MKILQIIAHPDLEGKSFTHQLAKSFRDGAQQSGDHTVTWLNVYELEGSDVSDDDIRKLVLEASHINFAYPCWWEMPPAKLVDLLQRIFVRGFAFDLDDGRMKPKLNIEVSCFISMGQDKDYNTTNLLQAMTYCGLYPMFSVFKNVGPRLTKENAELYLEHARRQGQRL